jgi:hypothetical protein
VSDAGGSEWDAWLAMLPGVESMRDSYPLLWSAARRRSYLQGSPTLDMLEKLLEECAADRHAIVDALGRQGTGDESAWPCLDDVLWAEAIITSRGGALHVESS